MTAPSFTITALCREFDVTPRALRFYEDRGLLNPARRGQARLYSQKDRVRLSLILRGKRLGFSLTEVAELIALYDPRDGGAVQLDRSLAAVDARIEQLQRQRQELDTVLAELGDVRDAMQQRRAGLAAHDPLPEAEDYDRVLRARIDA
jgi:DNA-binding transcriptional MerR regulator